MNREPTPDLLDLAETVVAGGRTLADAQHGLDRSDARELGQLVRAVSAVNAHALATRTAADERVAVVSGRAAASVSLLTPTAATDAVVADQRVRGGPVRLGGDRRQPRSGGGARWILIAATIALGAGLVAANAFVGTRIPPARPAATPNGVAFDPSASPRATSSPAPTSAPASAAIVGPDVLGDLETIEMMSATVGWGTTSQVIVRTEDGGRTWTTVHAGRGIFTRFVDDSAAAFFGPSPFDTIVTTQDGGRTWQTATITPPAQGEPIQLTFASPMIGFATFWRDGKGGPIVVFRTDDGGSTWTGPVAGDETGLQRDPSGPEAEGGDAGLIWSSPGKADNQPFDNRFSLSADGGATWAVRPFPVDPLAPAADQKAPESIRSDGAGHLVMVVRDVPAIFDSRDDGRTWTRVRAWSGPVVVELRSMTEWTAFAWTGSFVDATVDAGATWRRTVATQPPALVRKFGAGVDVTFGSPDVGLLLESAQREVCHLEATRQTPNPDPSCAPGQPLVTLRVTTDGGRTWTQIVP